MEHIFEFIESFSNVFGEINEFNNNNVKLSPRSLVLIVCLFGDLAHAFSQETAHFFERDSIVKILSCARNCEDESVRDALDWKSAKIGKAVADSNNNNNSFILK